MGGLLRYLGGAVSGWAIASFLGGLSLVLFGMSPEQLVAYVAGQSPAWLDSAWARVTLPIVGLAVIAITARYNVWDQQQKAIDELAEDLSWAIHHLLNRPTPQQKARAPLTGETLRTGAGDPDEWVRTWERDFLQWCARVSAKLSNRAFFTRADQLHFDRLGTVPRIPFEHAVNEHHNDPVSMLTLKFERLRELIQLIQSRRR